MWTKYFILNMIILCIAVIGVASTWIVPIDIVGWLSTKLLIVANLMAVYYLWSFGKMSRSSWRRGIFLLIAVYIIGALFKVQHWPAADIICSIAFLGIPVLYTIWFATKPVKQANDYLKLLWVVCYCLLSWAEFLHLFSLGIFSTIWSTALLQIIYIHFYIMQRRKMLAGQRVWDFESGSALK